MGSTHYFDTNIYNYFIDSPDGAEFVRALKKKANDKFFISPINIEEIKLAQKKRRIKLIDLLNSFEDQIVLVKHPDILGWLEFEKALQNKKFNGDIVEDNEENKAELSKFLKSYGYNTSEEELEKIKHKKLLNKYIQIVTRKEPKGKYSLSAVTQFRTEMMQLSDSELEQKIKEFGSTGSANNQFDDNDIVNGLKLRMIEVITKIRPQVKYFFDKETGPKMLQLTWPGKDKDRTIAKRINYLDFRQMCPGTWIRDYVYFNQSKFTIKPSNWADGAHAFYLAYTGCFWTCDENLYTIMKTTKVSDTNYCGQILYPSFLRTKRS